MPGSRDASSLLKTDNFNEEAGILCFFGCAGTPGRRDASSLSKTNSFNEKTGILCFLLAPGRWGRDGSSPLKTDSFNEKAGILFFFCLRRDAGTPGRQFSFKKGQF